MQVYCSIAVWQQENNKDFYELQEKLCLDLHSSTFINPNKEMLTEMKKLIKSKNKADRRKLGSLIRSLYLKVNLRDKNFRAGKYATLNDNSTVEISDPSAGTFTIKSGKDFKTIAKVKINNSFEPEWKYGTEDDKNMCVVDLISGEISHEGIKFTANMVSNVQKMTGASEYVKSSINRKLLNAEEVIATTRAELEQKVPVMHAAVCSAGLLKFVMMKCNEIPEYHDIGKNLHLLLCCEPFAFWYIAVQPFSSNQAMPSRLIEEWQFAPCVHPNFSSLWEEFCEKFPVDINANDCNEIKNSILESGGKLIASDLQEAYEEKCRSLFSNVNQFPCEQKLWLDEVCFYICSQMCEIRKNHDVSRFNQMCDVLKNTYPGNDHKSECIFGSEKYWEQIAGHSDVKNVKDFVESFCCLKRCHSGNDKLAHKCKEVLESLSGAKPSQRLKNTILLNQEFC